MKFDKVNSNRTSLLPFRGRTSSLTQADIFDEVYRKTYLSVYRYIYGLSAGSRQQAEDLTAETYLRAWKNRNSYQGKPDAAIAWLLRIARNLTIDSHRQCKARPELNANPLDEELNLSASAGANPEIRLIASEQQTSYACSAYKITSGTTRDHRPALPVKLENSTYCPIPGFS